jgi:hypothetical protein
VGDLAPSEIGIAMTIETTLAKACTAEKARALQRNEWKVVTVGGVRLRIHPPTSDAMAAHSGSAHYTASVEVAGESAANELPGDAESQAVVAELFGSEL